MERVNKIAYVASLDGDPILASELSSKRAIRLRKGADEIRRDELRTPPIYNYARCEFIISHHVAGVELGVVLPWTSAVEHVYYVFSSGVREIPQPPTSIG
jgi:hypothetical protein